jgi:tungstate transport system permease protein
MQLIRDGLIGAWQLLLERDPLVFDAAWRSFWISILAVVIAAAIGIPVGWFLARRKLIFHRLIVMTFRTGMSVPTVLIGLICFALFSRRGPLGPMELLYTPTAIVVGEFFLALPIITSWIYSTLSSQDRRIRETASTLGASPLRQAITELREARTGLTLAILTAFSRCFTELGIAMMVGGNLKFRTRTLTTATALETTKGEFERGIAMSLILLVIALIVTFIIAGLGVKKEEGDTC